MKIGIVCASNDELAPFLTMIDNRKITERAMLKFCEGQICDMQVVALFSGVCKVNAAIATQILIDIFGVNIVINAGVAGGMNPKLKIFDTVISTEVCYHDVAQDVLTEFHPWLKTKFFEADRELIKISERAVKETASKGKVSLMNAMRIRYHFFQSAVLQILLNIMVSKILKKTALRLP